MGNGVAEFQPEKRDLARVWRCTGRRQAARPPARTRVEAHFALIKRHAIIGVARRRKPAACLASQFVLADLADRPARPGGSARPGQGAIIEFAQIGSCHGKPDRVLVDQPVGIPRIAAALRAERVGGDRRRGIGKRNGVGRDGIVDRVAANSATRQCRQDAGCNDRSANCRRTRLDSPHMGRESETETTPSGQNRDPDKPHTRDR